MKPFVIIFIIIGVLCSLGTLGYLIYDIVEEKKKIAKLEEGGESKNE